MINYDPLLLDELTEEEFWLAQQVARHLSVTDGTAYPSTKRLQELVKWSDIKKVRRVRDQLVQKRIFEVVPRFLPDGRQTSNGFRVVGKRIGIYLGVDQVQEMRVLIEDLQGQISALQQLPTPDTDQDQPLQIGGEDPSPVGGKKTTPPRGKKHTPRGGKELTPEQEIQLTGNLNNLYSIPEGLNDDKFLEDLQLLLTQKKWKKKPVSAVQLAINKLSAYPVEFARELVQNAIVGEYQGVVFPSTPEVFKKWATSNNFSLKNNLHNGQPTTFQGNGFDRRFAESFNRTMGKIGTRYQEDNVDLGDPSFDRF
jgi:hypothetical protein